MRRLRRSLADEEDAGDDSVASAAGSAGVVRSGVGAASAAVRAPAAAALAGGEAGPLPYVRTEGVRTEDVRRCEPPARVAEPVDLEPPPTRAVPRPDVVDRPLDAAGTTRGRATPALAEVAVPLLRRGTACKVEPGRAVAAGRAAPVRAAPPVGRAAALVDRVADGFLVAVDRVAVVVDWVLVAVDRVAFVVVWFLVPADRVVRVVVCLLVAVDRVVVVGDCDLAVELER